MSQLWGINDNWTGDDYAHPVRERLSCLEALGLVLLILIGWTAALWLDSIFREASALKRETVQETK